MVQSNINNSNLISRGLKYRHIVEINVSITTIVNNYVQVIKKISNKSIEIET